MASDGAEDGIAALPGAVHLVESHDAIPSSTVVAQSPGRQSSVFSSPVSNLALNLEVLSTDGFSSQGSPISHGSLSTDG